MTRGPFGNFCFWAGFFFGSVQKNVPTLVASFL